VPLLTNDDDFVGEKDEAPKAPSADWKILINLYILCVLVSMPTFTVASRLPIFIGYHHKDLVGSTRIGFLIATYYVGFLIASPLVAKYASRVGRKNMLLMGAVLLTMSNLFYALSASVSGSGAFQVLTVIGRLTQGCA